MLAELELLIEISKYVNLNVIHEDDEEDDDEDESDDENDDEVEIL